MRCVHEFHASATVLRRRAREGAFERQHPGRRQKGGSYFRPARCLEGDGGSKGSGCAVCWDFPGVKWREGAGALWQPGCACATENRVVGGHIVGGLACQAPGIGYRQLACPRGPRSGGGYGVRFGEETRAGYTINHGDLLRAGDIGEAGGLEGDCERNSYCPCKSRWSSSIRTFFGR